METWSREKKGKTQRAEKEGKRGTGAQERAMEAEEREPLPLVRVPWSNRADRPAHYRILTFPKLLSTLSGGHRENQDWTVGQMCLLCLLTLSPGLLSHLALR